MRSIRCVVKEKHAIFCLERNIAVLLFREIYVLVLEQFQVFTDPLSCNPVVNNINGVIRAISLTYDH